jgi:cytochrome c oxidase subunit 4
MKASTVPEPIVQRTTYLIVYGVLLILLALTAATMRLHLGSWSLPVALLIATAKGVLIFLFFMRLRIHRGLTRIFACAGFLWLGILLTLAFSDYLTRGWLF